ncbi:MULTISPECIES: hypothetical protein [unclassified Methanoregula]|uniref:hypothetical protein n=1 Tax=unclassified Methanoregula TaxID=2649730 RepID=UPI0009D5D7D4|nr:MULTISPECIES: hypothetical protein [unclassified Methanoregula]OPX62910.1 MAG: hypothetical protein A4E33_02039 [Methanoregula sp. PtaB.Bin085]OPY35123.1 MAG: hypothetical protein A4E34_00928 [Methanoregula sp. PtaU1.Bin006]
MKQIKAGLLVLFLVLLVSSAGAAGGNGAGAGMKTLEAAGLTSMDTWYSFDWGSGVPAPAIPSFPYSGEVESRLIVTDAYNPGDQFKVYDGQVLLGVTSPPVPPVNFPPYWTGDPDTAYATSEFSKGCFNVAPGRHEFFVEAVQNPWGSGTGYLRIEAGSCPTTPAPEFPTLFLPLAFIAGLLGAVLIIRGRQNS